MLARAGARTVGRERLAGILTSRQLATLLGVVLAGTMSGPYEMLLMNTAALRRVTAPPLR